MRNFVPYILLFALLLAPAAAHAQEEGSSNGIKALTIEGGPILSHHFQSGDNNFRETHVTGNIKVTTDNYGTWGAYFLNPNSVNDTSIGVGYVTRPWTTDFGSTQLELTGAVGVVTGYQDYPLPFLAAEARLSLYRSGPWNAGLAMAAMPYIMEDDITWDNEFGVVATTPFLSVRYSFH